MATTIKQQYWGMDRNVLGNNTGHIVMSKLGAGC